MSQNFKLKFDEMKENDFDKSKSEQVENYSAPGHCFIQPDGVMFFLKFTYFIAAKYSSDDACIILEYTSYIVTIKGSALKNLFYELISHTPKTVTCSNERYSELFDKSDYIIKQIIVESAK